MTLRRLVVPGDLVLPNPVAGWWIYLNSPHASTTSATMGVGTLRVSPWVVYRTITLDRLGYATDTGTTADAGATYRLGIYADNGNCYPSTLIRDAGGSAADGTTGTREVTITSTTLAPGVYWVGGVVQNVTTTQPTIRTVSSWAPLAFMTSGSAAAPTASATAVGHSITGVTGALPGTFTAAGTSLGSGAAPRVFGRVA